jgi:hypothetical protein
VALGLPAAALGLFTLLDWLLVKQQGAQAVPQSSLLALVAIWLGLLAPMALVGGWLAGERWRFAGAPACKASQASPAGPHA